MLAGSLALLLLALLPAPPQSIQLNPDLQPGPKRVTLPNLTADGSEIFYAAQIAEGSNDAWRTSLARPGQASRVSSVERELQEEAFFRGYGIGSLTISPTGRHVVYRGMESVIPPFHLPSTPVIRDFVHVRGRQADGSWRTLLESEFLDQVTFSPDERWLATTDDSQQLVVVPLDEPSRGVRFAGRFARRPLFTAVSSRIVFRSTRPSSETKLFSAIPGETENLVLNDPSHSVQSVVVVGQVAFYRSPNAIWRVACDGSSPPERLGDLGLGIWSDFRVNNAGDSVLIRNQSTVWEYPVTGSPVLLRAASTSIDGMFQPPAGRRVVVTEGARPGSVARPGRVEGLPALGGSGGFFFEAGSPATIGFEDSFDNVIGRRPRLVFDPTGRWVAFEVRALPEVEGPDGILGHWIADLEGNVTPRLLPAVREIEKMEFDPEGRWLYLLARPTPDAAMELFRVPTDTAATLEPVNSPLTPGGEVEDFLLGPTGDVFYLADQERLNVVDLWWIPADPAALKRRRL